MTIRSVPQQSGFLLHRRLKHSEAEVRRASVHPDSAERVPARSPATRTLRHSHCSCCPCRCPRLAALLWAGAEGTRRARSLRRKVERDLPTLALTLPSCTQSKNLRLTARLRES